MDDETILPDDNEPDPAYVEPDIEGSPPADGHVDEPEPTEDAEAEERL